MLLTLPTEIVDHITGFSGTPDRLALAKTSKFLNDVASRRLFDEVILDDFNILPFLRTVITPSTRPSFIERCRVTRKLQITIRDPVFIARANPYICLVIRHMVNLRSVAFFGNNFSGRVMYMFLSRSGILMRRFPCRIPTLAAVENDDVQSIENLPRLKHLDVGGSINLLQLAVYRRVESIVVCKTLYLRVDTLIAAVNDISGKGNTYPSLKSLHFALMVYRTSDAIRAIEAVLSVFNNLEELQITIFSYSDSTIQNQQTDSENESQDAWPLHLPRTCLRTLRLKGNVTHVIGAHTDSGAASIALGQFFQMAMLCLEDLSIGRHAWKRRGKAWAYKYHVTNIVRDFGDTVMQRYRVWRTVNVVQEHMFEDGSESEKTLAERCRLWARRQRDWELRSHNGSYLDTAFTFGARS